MAEHLSPLRASVDRLRQLVATLDDTDLRRPAYPTEWTIADVLSHLGSGAVITERRHQDALAGHDTPDDFAPAVWDAWNAEDPSAQRDDALAADAALLDRLEATTTEERDRFATAMGPMTFGFDQFVGMRLNEHALHTWDIHVITDPTALCPRYIVYSACPVLCKRCPAVTTMSSTATTTTGADLSLIHI